MGILIWAAATLPVLVALIVEIVTSLRRGGSVSTSSPRFRCPRR